MNKETLRMQMLSGVITESEYKEKLNENETAEKLFQVFKDEGLLNDRREYDAEDFMLAYPDLSQEEAEKLEKMLQNPANLNEHYVAGGIVGIGAINQIPSRAKADYEDAFEHFLSQKYNLNEMEDDMPKAPSHEETDAAQVYEGKLDGLYMELKDVLFPYYTDLTGKERVDMIDNVIKELNSYILILQDEKKAKQ